ESELDRMTYLLSDGKWYRIEQSFVKLVDSDISRIKATSIVLPAYKDENEDAYNKRICRRSKGELALMHTRQIQYGGGSSSIEFCDAYSKKRIALHIKRYAGANALSHLFMQGANSAELLFFDREFRIALNRKLPPSHRLTRPGKRLDARKYEIAFVIISQSKKELNLPFFSRLTLRDAYRRLGGYGYAVTLTKVQASQGIQKAPRRSH
ncbi:MAG: TIGR04141 family sporadically distributed protein, partial [candidate division Zixibacteria bacterium]|nr:TIGR04141 family sporadically distributed protein [candidate division Zixibacteria bacterium]